MSPTVYLVSGAGRGIGYQFVEQLAAKPDTVIYAGVRSFPPPADSQLGQLAAKNPSVVIPIQMTSGDEKDNAAAAATVKAKVGKVDVIIANAGANSGLAHVIDLTPAQLLSDIHINTIGPLVLYKAFASLLFAANAANPGSAKFVVISSLIGQIADAPDYPYDGYGASKAAVNYLVKKIDLETPEVIAFPMHPGLVDTDMGREAMGASGVTDMASIGAISPAQSAQGVLAVIEAATKESHGGKFWRQTGEQVTF